MHLPDLGHLDDVRYMEISSDRRQALSYEVGLVCLLPVHLTSVLLRVHSHSPDAQLCTRPKHPNRNLSCKQFANGLPYVSCHNIVRYQKYSRKLKIHASWPLLATMTFLIGLYSSVCAEVWAERDRQQALRTANTPRAARIPPTFSNIYTQRGRRQKKSKVGIFFKRLCLENIRSWIRLHCTVQLQHFVRTYNFVYMSCRRAAIHDKNFPQY